MDQKESKKIEQKDWSEFKQFKDPVYGYIPVNRVYVDNLIDTQMMQRIKGVAQTGLKPVFSSATHDRFSHSLGVYKFGMMMYDSLESKLLHYTKETCFPKWKLNDAQKNSIYTQLEKSLKHWKTLLAIGCLLHDIGHPVQSHGFEFLYDDPYLDVDYDKANEPVVISEELDPKEQERVYNLLIALEKTNGKTPEGNLRGALLDAFNKKGDYQKGPIPGNPHERMSAYYILKDKELEENVRTLIIESRKMYGFDGELDERDIKKDICFIARMIIGWEYPVAQQLSFHKDDFFNSIKNCVIHILNGEIDADGIDYLMRNSYAAGYDTSKIDSTRLCNAYTAYEKHFIMLPAFSKSALSVLEGYISARNFEPKWLYSHHKVVYSDLLTKRLFKYTSRYLTDRIMLAKSVKLFLKHASKSALVYDNKQDFGTDLMLKPQKNPVKLGITELESHVEQWSYPFYTYLLAPCRRYTICSHYFSRTADADLEALFHWMINELAEYKGDDSGELDQETIFREYKRHLKKNILDGLRNNTSFRYSSLDIRILLAETFLEKIYAPSENDRAFLKKWAETGIIDTTIIDTVDKSIKDKISSLESSDEQEMLQYWLDLYKPLLSSSDFIELINLLEEYKTRRYRRSLWKSLSEYQLFLIDCAFQLGISSDDVHRYLLILIEQGMREHGFSIFDGKSERIAPELYREQFFYQCHKQEDRRKEAERLRRVHKTEKTTVPLMSGKQIAQKWANIIFAKTKDYDFSQTKLAVRFYRIKSKKFDKIRLIFGNRAVPLSEVFPSDNGGGNSMFPYLYYQKDSQHMELEKILIAFQTNFIEYCREYRESEVRSEPAKMRKNYVFRDAVYGDIEMPESFYTIVRTREFQRLGRIRQLATADRSFPNATHTRLAHSIGTWHVMRLILQHFKQHYKTNPQLRFSEEDENCALLAALLHDLGHGPYSHTFEEVFDHKLDHEEMTRRIIMDTETEISTAIEKEFGIDILKRVYELLSSTSFSGSDIGINLIYRTIISGQLDADRIDYLLRDNTACGMSFGHIDIQQLIASMRMLPVYDTVQSSNTAYRLCFDDRYLPAIEQFIYARYQMYKNVYHDPKKLLFEQLIKCIFRMAFSLGDEVKSNPVFSVLKRIYDNNSLNVSEYISLDDETLNGLLKTWASGDVLEPENNNPDSLTKAEMITTLSKAFLNQSPLFEQVDLGTGQRQYDLLANRIGKQLGVECNTFSALCNNSCAFIYVNGEDYAYRMYAEEKDKKNILLRNLDDGTTSDYMHRSLFRAAIDSTDNTILKTDYYYLFFSKELLSKECSMLGKSDEPIKQIVESAKLRKHIEIEKKFYCTEKQLRQAEEYLDEEYKAVKKIKNEQTDTYYDCKVGDEWLLSKHQFSFRCRRKDNQYNFTIKIPTNSPNYRSPSQFARYEHEMISTDSSISNEVCEFLINTLDIYGGNTQHCIADWCSSKKNDPNLKDTIETILIVENQRITYSIEGKCEVCLDRVNYKTADNSPVGSQSYQIEIELLSEPETWSTMESSIIEPLVLKLGKDALICTNESKLERGLSLLGKSNTD